jgi:hypothetical protein
VPDKVIVHAVDVPMDTALERVMLVIRHEDHSEDERCVALYEDGVQVSRRVNKTSATYYVEQVMKRVE